ncbi:protein kinase-like domain, concanavalin A-like lectin/glucanase domain protein [Tanacetum coccineum]
MGNVNPIRTLGYYSKPCHEVYKNTIELPVGNNVVSLRSDTIRLVQNGCSFHELPSEDPNQHLKDFLKLVDSLDLDGENREKTRLHLLQFSLRDQASNWLERLPAGSITIWEDLTTRFLAQFFLPGRTVKLCNDILMNAKESWALLEDLAFYDNESLNDPRDFSMPVKAISLPQDILSTFDRRLIELENQVECLMEAHLAPMQPTQVNKITSLCEICSGPTTLSTAWKMLNKPLLNMHPRVPTKREVSGLVSNFMSSQDARLSKFEADFKQQQSEMNNKIDIVLKAITDRIAGALPSDTVKNPKLNINSTTLVLSARSYPTEDPQCSTHIHEGNPKDTDDIAHNEEQRDTPQLELKDIYVVDNLGPNRDEEGIEWLDVKEPLDLVDTSEESVYESLIKDMPKCLLSYDFRIKKGDPRNLKIPCMIGHKFTANAYIDIDLPMNIMSLAYYNTIRKNRYEYMGRNFIGLGKDMHIYVGNMSYVMDFTILENIETNIDPILSNVVFGRPFIKIACLAINRKYGLMTFTDGIKEITFKTPYKDPERSELSSEGHDLLSSRVILSKDDYDRG